MRDHFGSGCGDGSSRAGCIGSWCGRCVGVLFWWAGLLSPGVADKPLGDADVRREMVRLARELTAARHGLGGLGGVSQVRLAGLLGEQLRRLSSPRGRGQPHGVAAVGCSLADAFGQALLDGSSPEIVERDDGFIANRQPGPPRLSGT